MLVFCFAGLTLPAVTTHLSKDLFGPALGYVACSRVRSINGLFLTELDERKVLVSDKGKSQCNEAALYELVRLETQKFLETDDNELISSVVRWRIEYIFCSGCKHWCGICTCNN